MAENNKFGPNPFDLKPRKIDIYVTSVEVQCEGCVAERKANRSVNIRVLEENFNSSGHGIKHKHCSRCMAQTQFEVQVFSSGAISVFQSDKFGAGKHKTSFQKLDQRKVKKEVR